MRPTPVTVTASTGASVVVWHQFDSYYARRVEGAGGDDVAEEPQICLGVDLFEVIAELAGLRLEHPHQSREAQQLARHAQAQLT